MYREIFPAGTQLDHLIGQKGGLLRVVGDEEEELPGLQLPEKLQNFPLPGGVQPLKGLIQEKNLPVPAEGPGQSHPPPHSAAEAVRTGVQLLPQTQTGQPFRAAGAGNLGILQNRQPGEQPVLLKDHRDAFPVHPGHRAGIRAFQTQEDAEQGGFPHSGGAHQGNGSGLREGVGEPVQNHLAAEALGQAGYGNGHGDSSFRAGPLARRSTSFSTSRLKRMVTAVQQKTSRVSR